MPLNTLVDKEKLENKLTSIADTIRTKGKTEAKLNFYGGDYENAINALSNSSIELDNIQVTKEPDDTNYLPGEIFNKTGMTVRANYTNQALKDNVAFDYTPKDRLKEGANKVDISYTEFNVTKTTTQAINVERGIINTPSQSGSLTYNGNPQSPNWNENYQSDKMEINGTTTATNAGTYNATFTPTYQYKWPDGQIVGKDAPWTINRAEGKITLTPPSPIELNPQNTSKIITINKLGDGNINIEGGDRSIFTPTLLSNDQLKIETNNNKSGNTELKIKAEQGTNHLEAFINLLINAKFWNWDNQTAVGDSAWWNGLKSWIIAASPEERAACLGKTRRVSLSSSVLGSNQVLMRCVGYDLDGSKTLTFAAVNALAQKTTFGSSNAIWIGSTVRSKCQKFYNACSAKNAILTVSKGTCPSTNSSRNGTPTYNNETVFLMSERELGLDQFSPISTNNSNPNKAECTKGYNESYQYFTSDDKRIVYLGNANGDATSSYAYPWERSLYYDYTSSACNVGNGGLPGDDYYGNSRGFAPAFAIGQA